jgi:hypothetical protein
VKLGIGLGDFCCSSDDGKGTKGEGGPRRNS